MRKPDDAHDEVASAGGYRVYKVVKNDGTVAYELAGTDATIPREFRQLQEAMAAMTALLARPIGDDQGGAGAPPSLPGT